MQWTLSIIVDIKDLATYLGYYYMSLYIIIKNIIYQYILNLNLLHQIIHLVYNILKEIIQF